MFRKKSVLITFICLFIVAAISFVYVLNGKQSSRFDIRQKEIKTIEMSNNLYQKKEITNYFDKKKLISIIQSVTVVKSNIDQLYGDGDTIKIKYNDGFEQNFNFLAGSMGTNDNLYQIRENKLPELNKIYNKEQMTTVRKIICYIFIAVAFLFIGTAIQYKNKYSKAVDNGVKDYQKYINYNYIFKVAEAVVLIILAVSELVFSYGFSIMLISICILTLLYNIMLSVTKMKFKRC